MPLYHKIIFTLLAALPLALRSQTVQPLQSGTNASLRGLSVVSDQVVWASGAKGTVGKSLDGGATWQWLRVKGFDSTDFRDIEAFDATTAIIMGIGEPAYLLKTVDGGDTWKVVYENKTKGMFLDAMEFWNEQSGIVLGDPIEGRFFIARTFDGGSTWREIPLANRPSADSGEACFASSGTNIRRLSNSEACFVSGGLRSRLFIRNEAIQLPILQGRESTGANSVAVANKKTLLVVGGDFSAKDSTAQNCYTTFDGGKTWQPSLLPPHGYRSCVEYLGGKKWVTCGLNGADYSSDHGRNWQWIAKEGYHVCRKAKTGKAVFFAGGGGRIGKLIVP
jgi:photosystem II stability/assembly factor-like uncharacterized protein